MTSGARYFADVLLGFEGMEARRRSEIREYLVSVVRARGFPLHLTNLWNALYFAFDVEQRAYYGAGLDPDALPLRQMHRQSEALPVGAFVRVAAANRELWAEVVYKEGRHPDLLVLHDEHFRQVNPAVSGAPAQVRELNERPVAVVQEALVLDFDAFGVGLNDTTQVQFDRLLRKQVWLDEYGHLVFDAVYEPPERANDDDTTAYARYLFDRHREGLLSQLFASFLRREVTDDEAWALLLASFGTVGTLAASCAELVSWRNYFFDRGPYLSRVADEGAEAFLGADDLRHLLRTLAVAPPGAVGYRSLSVELLTLLSPGPLREQRHELFEGPGYTRAICYANRWIADQLVAPPPSIDADRATVPEDEIRVDQLIDDIARASVDDVTDMRDLATWFRPSLQEALERNFDWHETQQRRRVGRRRASEAIRPILGAEPTTRRLGAQLVRAIVHLGTPSNQDERGLPTLKKTQALEEAFDEMLTPYPDRGGLSPRERRLDQAARRLVNVLRKNSGGRESIEGIPSAVVDRVAFHLSARSHSSLVDLRIDDEWQSGGIWRVERMRSDSSLVGIPPTLPLGLGYASTATAPPSAPPPDLTVTSQTGWRVALSLRDLSAGELRLSPASVGALVSGAATVTVRLRHADSVDAFDAELDTERRVLTGMRWPMDAIPGMYVSCNIERQGKMVRVRSAPLVPPREVDGVLLRYEFDEGYYLGHRNARRLDHDARRSASSLRDLVLAAFRHFGARRDGAYELELPMLLHAVLGAEYSPTDAGPVLIALQTLDLERQGGRYRWRPRVTHRTSAGDRTLLEEFGVTPARARHLVRRVVPMHIRRYTKRRPSPEKIHSYALARAASGIATLPRELQAGASWVKEYELGRGPEDEEDDP